MGRPRTGTEQLPDEVVVPANAKLTALRSHIPHPDPRLSTAVDTKKIYALRLAGFSEVQIADHLAITLDQVEEAYLIEGSMSQQRKANALEMHSALDLDRLDALLATVWPDAMANDPKAVANVLAILDRRSKLLGLEASERRAAFANAKGLEDSDLSSLSLEEIKTLAALQTKLAEAKRESTTAGNTKPKGRRLIEARLKKLTGQDPKSEAVSEAASTPASDGPQSESSAPATTAPEGTADPVA